MKRDRIPMNIAKTQSHLMDLAWAAPLVIAERLAEFSGKPTPWHAKEWQRMHSEKWEAWTRGWAAMGADLMRAQLGLFGSIAPKNIDPWSLLAAGIAPTRHRAVANARRLTRRRSR